MNIYLKGQKLYGDDFLFEEIEKWYLKESEGYADLGSSKQINYTYGYHELNKMHGFNYIKEIQSFENVLGFGSAWGLEFEIIIDKISKLIIIEPSDKLISKKIGDIYPMYIKPNIDGKLEFKDNSFDLITCFGTLHHIPNVTFVLGELIRVLKKDGYLLLREPIRSMGDWELYRKGLTKNERGIPPLIFDEIFKQNNVKIVSKKYCFTMTPFFQRTLGKILMKPIYSNKIISYLINTFQKC